MNTPKIKYVIISLTPKIILCEVQIMEIPNIKGVIRHILDKNVNPNDMQSINYDKIFSIFYKNDSLITVLCVTDINYPNGNAFKFITEIMNKFRQKYDEENIKNSSAYSYNQLFKKEIESLVEYYNSNLDSKDSTKILQLKDNLLDMNNELIETVETINLRGNELSINIEKAEKLKKNTDELVINARKVKNSVKNIFPYKRFLRFIVIILSVYFILVIMCGGRNLPNCSIL
jgi:vesicle-associated membrane protein 7